MRMKTETIPNFDENLPQDLSNAKDNDGTLLLNDVPDEVVAAVVENDDNARDDGKLMSDVINQGFSSFTPDMVFDALQKDFAVAKNMYGESILRLVAGMEPNYIKKNLNIPEFKRELNEKIKEKLSDLQKKGLLSKDGEVTEKGLSMASLVLYAEEMDNLIPKGFLGEKQNKREQQYGDKADYRAYKQGDSYRNIDLKRSIKHAIRRGSRMLSTDDLHIAERESKGSISLIYAIDASGSMKGKKIEAAKKAGIALAYKAIEQKDPVGLIVFGTEVKESVRPTTSFPLLLSKITPIQAGKETNMTEAIIKSLEMFPKGDTTKHLVILTDGMPSIGKNPEQDAIEAVSIAMNSGISVSIVGVNLDAPAKEFCSMVAAAGNGKLHLINNLNNLDTIILEDYNSLQ